jgi:hypothetical protein
MEQETRSTLLDEVNQVEARAMEMIEDVVDELNLLWQRAVELKEASARMTATKQQGERLERSVRCALDTWADGVGKGGMPWKIEEKVIHEHADRVLRARAPVYPPLPDGSGVCGPSR